MKKFTIEILSAVLVGVLIFFLLQFSVQKSKVDGSSMEPNLQNGQVLVISKLTYNFGNPQRGDIIVFDPPHIIDSEKDYIKRIIGLPDDTVEIVEGTVYINGQELEESYITEKGSRSINAVVVPQGEYYVLGDNRNDSGDSRSGWTVPEENIVGKAWICIWPFDNWGMAPNEDLSDSLVYYIQIEQPAARL